MKTASTQTTMQGVVKSCSYLQHPVKFSTGCEFKQRPWAQMDNDMEDDGAEENYDWGSDTMAGGSDSEDDLGSIRDALFMSRERSGASRGHTPAPPPSPI